MKPKDRQAARATSAAETRKFSEDKRDLAFRRHREAEKAANAEKTERLKKLRLAKEAVDREQAEAAKLLKLSSARVKAPSVPPSGESV